MIKVEQANIQIFEVLKKRIINLELKPGDPIIEKDLVEEFGVSRTPVREALIKLSQIGLVETRPRVGTFVTQVDLKQVKDSYEVKKTLEGLASELAATRATKEEIDELFKIIERFAHYDIVKDYKLCIEDDQKFHRIIRQASRNDMLIEVLEVINTRTARFLQSIEYVINDDEMFNDSLNKMANAIRDRDAALSKKVTEEHTKDFVDQMSRRFFRFGN